MDNIKNKKPVTVDIKNCNENEIPNDLQSLKELDSTSYAKVYYYIRNGMIKKYKTEKGFEFSIGEYKNYITNHITDCTRKKAYRIDTSTTAKINCLYKRFIDMDKANKELCQRDNRLTRYIDQNGNTCINIRNYIQPQIKLLAKKLECKEKFVFAKIYELIQELHKKRRE